MFLAVFRNDMARTIVQKAIDHDAVVSGEASEFDSGTFAKRRHGCGALKASGDRRQPFRHVRRR